MSNRQPSLGVVIVNYNYARFLPDAIESALRQNPPFDEIVIVDDGSTDNSRDVIAAYQPKVKVVHQPNGGSLSAALSGISAIATDYVYILDSDDYLTDGAVRMVKSFLKDSPVKLQFQLLTVNEEGQRTGARFPTYANEYGRSQMLDDNRIMGFYHCPTTSANVFHRTTLTQLDWNKLDKRDSIDGPLAMAMPYLGPVVAANEAIGHYRIHGNSQSRWSDPTQALLQSEIDRFYTRWTEVCGLVHLPQPPFGNHDPLYVLEVKLMLAALADNQPVTSLVIKYVRRLLPAHFAAKQKLMLCAWAAALLIPLLSLRKKLVFARRSPVNRPRFLQSLVRLLTAGRKRSPVAQVPDSNMPREIH